MSVMKGCPFGGLKNVSSEFMFLPGCVHLGANEKLQNCASCGVGVYCTFFNIKLSICIVNWL